MVKDLIYRRFFISTHPVKFKSTNIICFKIKSPLPFFKIEPENDQSQLTQPTISIEFHNHRAHIDHLYPNISPLPINHHQPLNLA